MSHTSRTPRIASTPCIQNHSRAPMKSASIRLFFSLPLLFVELVLRVLCSSSASLLAADAKLMFSTPVGPCWFEPLKYKPHAVTSHRCVALLPLSCIQRSSTLQRASHYYFTFPCPPSTYAAHTVPVSRYLIHVGSRRDWISRLLCKDTIILVGISYSFVAYPPRRYHLALSAPGCP